MTDNVDVFKKIIFSIPTFRKTLAITLLASIVYSTLIYACIKLFTSLQPGILSIPVMAGFALALPSLVSGELFYWSLPDYPRKWGYFLALSCQSILFIYGLILTGANNFANAWHIFWLALATVYLANLFVLALTLGYEHLSRIAALSAAQPLLVLASFHIFLGARLQLSPTSYMKNLLIFGVAGVVLLFTFFVVEYLIRSNLEGVSVLKLTAGLLQKKQEALDLGYSTRPDVQTLEVENEEKKTEIAVPWIHPGPLEGFGGGRVTSNIIQNLNREGEGFFLHVPSTHKSDPADPEDYRKILEAMQEPGKSTQASKLVSGSYRNVDFYGRKIDGRKIVFMDAEYDDYELSVFREVIDPDEVLLVDLHCQDREEEDREEVWYNTETAEHLRGSLKDFLGFLEKQEMSDYRAGFSTDVDGKPVFSLVEEVDGQETLIFGVEGNGTSERLRDLRENYREEFDEVLVFSTDTHQSIHELSADNQVEVDRVREVVGEASGNLSSASIGFANGRAETMRLLQEDYSGLIFSINILIRLVLLMLAAVYLWLVYWVFL
ncbi:MAG: DUF2070 family protein [Candidatus Nanohalobium sp.]